VSFPTGLEIVADLNLTVLSEWASLSSTLNLDSDTPRTCAVSLADAKRDLIRAFISEVYIDVPDTSIAPALCFAKIPCALKIVRFPATMAASSRLSLHPQTPRICPGEPSGIPAYIRMEEPGRLHDAALIRIRQPDRTGGAALPVVDEKGRDRRLRCEFFPLAFPPLVRDVCGPRGSSEYTQRAGVSGGVRQLR
jgi:hypothetical protein